MKISETLKSKGYRMVLASQSPRRKKLLEQIGLKFDIIPSDIDEKIDDLLSPQDFVQELAFSKAAHIAIKLAKPSVVIGADTIVVLDDLKLNKPIDEADAFQLLSRLSGRTHKVYTGISLFNSKTGAYIKDYQVTDVTFRELNESEIKDYIAGGSPMDKAGAYGIQDDFGSVFVSHINGCYYNIVGLPMELTYRRLKEFIDEL